MACRFGDQIVNTILNSDDSISCRSPPVRRVYEIQQLTTALVPYQPQEVRLTAASGPVEGAKFDIIVQNDDVDQAVQSVTVEPSNRVTEIQTVTVSTDDPPFFNTTMTTEYNNLKDVFDWDEDIFKVINQNAIHAAFCGEKQKLILLERINSEWTKT